MGNTGNQNTPPTPSAPRISPFDAIKQTDEYGGEYWSARDLGKLLTYKSWQKFEQVIADAMQACERSKRPPVITLSERIK